MVKDLNLYCSKIYKIRANQWHPDTLFEYLQASIYDFLPEELWDFYYLDKKDLQFKFKDSYLNFEI